MWRDKFGLRAHAATTGRAGGGDKAQSHTPPVSVSVALRSYI